MKSKQYLNSDYIIYEDGRCYSNKSHKFLTPQMTVKYPTYNLTLDGIKKKTKIHRMVAETFIDNPENKPIINHIDGDTHNFHISNLEWVTESENSKHARATGLSKENDQNLILLKDSLIPNEIWVELINYPNYKISNFGRILNNQTQRIKRTPLDNHGYPHTNLWSKGQGKTHQVHKLVYQSFHPEDILEGFVINHIDGNKTNNCLSNLEKVSYSENNKHAEYIIKTHGCAKSVLKLNDNEEVVEEFPSVAEAQRITGINNLSRAIKKHYRSGGYYWKFKD